MKRFLSIPRVTLLGALMLSSAAWAATPADTVIRNTATADYISPTTNQAVSAQSNSVETVVMRVCSVSVLSNNTIGTVSSPAQTVTVLPGESATFKYVVTNTSNYKDTFALTAPVTASGNSPEVLIYLDANNNGVVDAGEVAISSVTLEQNATANLLVVLSQLNNAGRVDVALSTGCANAPAVSSVNRVEVNASPDIRMSKSFVPAAVRPGQETTVSVVATNNSGYDSREVVLSDDLAQQRAAGLEYVRGTAKVSGPAGAVIEYTSNGTTWSSSEPSAVLGIRVRAPKLASKETLTLSFGMRGTEAADGKSFENVATVTSSGKTSTANSNLKVGYAPTVNLTPKPNPNAPEGSPEDRQTIPTVIVGEETCFEHLLTNTGDVDDVFDITVAIGAITGSPVASTTYLIKDKDGNPLQLPLPLAKGESVQVNICYTPTTEGSFDSLVTVTGKRGSTNTTRDIVGKVEQGAPELTKALTKAVNKNGQQQTDLSKAVEAGSEVTYTIKIKNPYNRPLTNVKLIDTLDPLLSYVSSTKNGSVITTGTPPVQEVTWTFANIPAQGEEEVTITAKISESAKDGTVVKNSFRMTSDEFSSPRQSNSSEVVVFDLGKIVIQKDVTPKVVSFGDRLTYTLTIPNNSNVAPILDPIVADEPDKGLTYVPGSSTISISGGAETTLSDPSLDLNFSAAKNKMAWNVAKIDPGGSITIKYQMTVNTRAAIELNNVVQVTGTVSGTNARAIASNRATAQATIDPTLFAPISDIVGRVFVDRNKDRIFNDGLDTPVERARVIMAGGRIAITDKLGRYNFSNVPYGTQALRLDQNTIPYAPLQVMTDGGLSGTQTVHVRGLTAVDFPLAPLGGEIDAVRRTTLKMGELTVDKAVYQVGTNEYTVTLKLNTPKELSEFSLSDPLPQNAVLSKGSNTMQQTLPAGETNTTYTFTWDGEIREVTTDPTASWRY